MVDQMVKEAKIRRGNRTLSAFIVGGIIGLFVFSGLEVALLAGGLFSIFVWIWESREVDRVKKIQNPWEGKDGQ